MNRFVISCGGTGVATTLSAGGSATVSAGGIASSTRVSSGAGPASSGVQPSSKGERASVSNRPGTCESAPRSLVIRLEWLSLSNTVYMYSYYCNGCIAHV